jgi:phosphoglycerate kinase
MLLYLRDIDLAGKRLLIREDFNVPMQDGKITSDQRILAALPTIQYALKSGACVMLMSHLGRPSEGEIDAIYSLLPVARRLSELLGQHVPLITDWLQGCDVKPGEVVLCENVRFNRGETSNDNILALQMASLCDVFVMDAFGTAHRAHASTFGVARYAPLAAAGPLLEAELKALTQVMEKPKHPVVAIVGGSKVSSKLMVLNTLSQKVDQLIVGGGIANTFLAAAGFKIGKSLYEPDLVPQARTLLATTIAQHRSIPLPVDVVVASEFSANATAVIKSVDAIKEDEMILDVGPQTIAQYKELLKNAQTILWNGPLGVFEFPQFAKGTQEIAKAIAQSAAFSVAGGGDTLAAIDEFGVHDDISYVSTGGGAFLAFLEGKQLPGVAILEQRAFDKENI